MMHAATHIPVMLRQTVATLAPRAGGLYCDATLGLGGHAQAVLEASAPDGRLVGIDRDPQALGQARQQLGRFGDRVAFCHGRFGDLSALLSQVAHETGWQDLAEGVDGLLADLGVSSLQLDRAERGFGFRQAAPLDMRMDPEADHTAAEWLRVTPESELATALRRYGDVPRPRTVARAIRAYLAEADPPDTAGLASAIARGVGPAHRARSIHPATQSFMAIRIAVNDELGELDRLLEAIPSVLAPGGRAVLLTFHSLEDRLVKRRFAHLSRPGGTLPPSLPLTEAERGTPPCALLTRHPVSPSAREVSENPRARSARLRAIQRTAEAKDLPPMGEAPSGSRS